MTEENIWKVLDAWRENKECVTFSSYVDVGVTERILTWTPQRCADLDTMLPLLNDADTKWFIDGEEVV